MDDYTNIELIKQAYVAFKRGDVKALLALFTEDFRFSASHAAGDMAFCWQP